MKCSPFLLGLALLSVGSPAFAGANYGGVLVLHVNEGLVHSSGSTHCGLSGATSCVDVDARVDNDGIESVVVYALAAFPPESSPRLSGVIIGLAYDEQSVGIEDWGSCGDFYLATAGGDYPAWPEPGSGVAITWNEAQTAQVIECAWFAAYSYDGSAAFFSIDDHPVKANAFADDSIPSVLDEPIAHGSLGFNMDGSTPCDEVWNSTLNLSPSAVTVYRPCDQPFPIKLSIDDIEDLGSFKICTGYDGSLLEFDRVEIDPAFLGSTGRVPTLLWVQDCEPTCQADGTRYWVNLNGAGPGPSGSGPLVDLYFTPAQVSSNQSTVCQEVISITNTSDESIYSAPGPGIEVTHSAFCFGDFDGSGDVTALDLSRNIPRWGSCAGDAEYDEIYDLNLLEEGNYCASMADGCIDVIDIQRVAGRWHLGCGEGARAPQQEAGLVERSPSATISSQLQMRTTVGSGTPLVNLFVESAADLGAFEVEIAFDPEVLHLESVENGEMLSRTGRNPYFFEPEINNETGLVRIGSCSVGEVSGPDGSGVLAEFFFEFQNCDEIAAVTISAAILTSTSGMPLDLGDGGDSSVDLLCTATSAPVGDALAETALFSIRPNPITATTEILFHIADDAGGQAAVELSIFDASGRLVRTLIDRDLAPGPHRSLWDARDGVGNEVASGSYFYRLRIGSWAESRQFVVIR